MWNFDQLHNLIHYLFPIFSQVRFFAPIVVKDRKINEWLSMVEKEMRMTLARLLATAVQDQMQFKTTTIDQAKYLEWADKYQAQLVVLAAQIAWSESVEAALLSALQAGGDIKPLEQVLEIVESTLNVLADSVLHEQPPVRRKKLEHLVIFLPINFNCTASAISNFKNDYVYLLN